MAIVFPVVVMTNIPKKDKQNGMRVWNTISRKSERLWVIRVGMRDATN